MELDKADLYFKNIQMKHTLISADEIDKIIGENGAWQTLSKHDVITTGESYGTVEIIRIYKMTDLKRLFLWAGLKKSWFLGVKVKPFTQLFVDL